MNKKNILISLGFIVSFYYQSIASDQNIIEIEPPVVQRQRPSVNQIQGHYLGNGSEITALESYPFASPVNLGWGNLDQFAEQLDQGFFKGASVRSMVLAVSSGLIGFVPSHPACGYLLTNIGDFLQLPISSPASNAMISFITISTTPAFFQEFFTTGKEFSHKIFKEESFQHKDSPVKFFDKEKKHYALKGTLLLSAAINAAIPTILMREAEKEFPLFFALTAAPFYVAWLQNSYKIGSSNLDYLFCRYHYAGKSNHQKREILKNKIRSFKEEIVYNDPLVSDLYRVIQDQRLDNFKADDGAAFAFSAFFLRSVVRLEDEGQLINYRIDAESDPHSIFDETMNWLSGGLTAASTYTKYCVTQSVLDTLFKEAFNEQTSFILSTSLATFEAVHRILTTHHSQTETLKSFRYFFTASENLVPVRKAAGMLAAANAALFSLPNLVAGLHLFSDMPILGKVANLGPAFAVDALWYNAFFSKNYHRFISNVSTLKNDENSLFSQRAYLTKHAERAGQFIDKFDSESIEKLFSMIMKGV